MLDGIIRREFNQWAAEGHGRGMEKSHWDVTRQLIDMMNVQPHENVLDLGCGVGWATRVLAERASRGLVVGIDLSDGMIRQAISNYRNPSNAIFLVADAEYLPCRDSFFASLLSVESIYYYPNLTGSLEEIYRILRPGGKAHFLLNYYKENVYSHPWAKYIDIPLHLLATEDYLRLLSAAGFSVMSHRRISDSAPLPEDWTPSKWFPTKQDLLKFQSEGALLITAEK